MKTYIKQHLVALLALLAVAATQAFAADTKTALWTNYSPNGSSFSKTQTIDFNTQSIEAEIDLSNCGTTYSLQNILSIGNDIAEWSTKGKYNLHMYYTASSKQLEIDYLPNGGGREQTLVTLTSTTLNLKLSAEGLSVNGVIQVEASSISPLLALTSVSIGSQQGDNRSYATYKSVNVVTGSSTGTETETTKFVTPIAGNDYYICLASDATKGLGVTSQTINARLNVSTLVKETTTQTWTAYTSKSSSYPLLFKSKGSVFAIDMAGTNTTAPLIWTSEFDYNSGLESNANQEWKLVDAGNSTYYLACRPQKSSSDYYLAVSGTGLTKTTLKTNATAFGFLKASASEGGGGTEGGGGSTEETPGDHGSFDVSMVHNPQKFAQYKEDAHATYIPYASSTDMMADANYEKPWLAPTKAMTMSLNGTWKFKYISNYNNQAPLSTYYSNTASTSGWDNIRVPLSWEMAGYDTPVYTNEGNPGYPFTPVNNSWTTQANYRSNCDTNPLGYYRRTFTLPTDWNDKRVMVHFDGAYSAIAVYINGKYVGYSQGANTDAEFDITDFVSQTDENNITVACFRWSDGSYLEGQDMWHLSGIHRDVYLVATPKVFISDHYIHSSLNSNYTSGSMTVDITIDNRTKSSVEKNIKVELLDATGTSKGTQTITYSGSSNATRTVTFSNLNGLTPWSAENPYLYTVVVSQLDGTSEEMVFSTKYGFRKVEVVNNYIQRQVLVNGKRVFFKGVNTQDTHPLYGRAIDLETMMKDVTLMKQANVNTVRTSHYPRQPKMYALFDAYGLYCMDEADIECHGANAQGFGLSASSTWTSAYVDRTERMVRRDRNHPSVVFYSLGNESGSGSNFGSTYQKVKDLTNNEGIVHYEADASHSDLGSNMYPSVSDVSSNSSGLNNKPYFICEYAHAMGNAMGRLKDYWNVIESSTGIIGACVWDWVDQSIYDPQKAKLVINGTADANTLVSPNGFNYWKQGYDYQNPSGGTFMGAFHDNGITTPDRKWSSKLTEVRKVYQYIDFTQLSNKKLTVKNKYAFTNLDNFKLIYRVLKNGELAEEGMVDMPSVTPGSTGTVSLPYKSTAQSGEEMVVNVYLILTNGTLWADNGYAVADEQFVVQNRNNSLSSHTASGSLSVSGNTVSGNGWSMTFNSDGSLKSWTYNDQTIMNAAPAFSQFFSIDNSRNDTPYNTGSNNSYSVKSNLRKNSNGTATLTVSGSSDRNYTIAYTIYPDGVVDMAVNFNGGYNTAYRVGLAMQFGEGFEQVEYYGRGPWANYPDRMTGSYLGRYVTCVNDLFEEYTHPQTNGDHQNLRDLTLTSSKVALKIETVGDVSFSMSHYQESYWSAKTWMTKKHNDEMTRQGSIYAHFDAAISGVGNGSCGEGTPSQYLPNTGSYSYTLRFTPTSLK